MANNLSTELFLVILPLKRLLKPYQLNITPKDTLKIQEFPATAEKILSKFVKDKPLDIANDLSVSDTKKLLEDIALPMSDLVLGETINGLNAQGVDGIEISQSIRMVMDIARAFLPKQDQELPVSNSQLTKLTWVLRIIDNPLYVFNLMAHNQLTDVDVNTLKFAYPLLYDALSQILVKDLIASGNPLTRSKKLMLSIFLQIPVITPEILQEYLKPTTNTQADLNVAATGA